jgi:hypothetical protein
MNTWSLLSMGLLGGIPLISLLVLVWCAKRAPEGHEDADGFHAKQIYYDAFADRRQVSPAHTDGQPLNSVSL